MLEAVGTEPFGMTMFCEDIRQEVGKKTSLIGIYESTTVEVEQLPLERPIIYARIRFLIPGSYVWKTPEHNLFFKIYKETENGVTTEIATTPAAITLSAKKENVSAYVVHSKIAVSEEKKEFTLKSRAYFDDHEYRLGIITFRIGKAKPSSE